MIKLLQRLSSKAHARVTLSICRELGISRRTFFRDLDTLRSAGIPVRYDTKAREFCLGSRFNLDWISNGFLTWQDAVALLAILSIVESPDQSELCRHQAELRAKVVSWLRHNHQDDVNSIIANAKLLTENPSASIREMHRLCVSARTRLRSVRMRELVGSKRAAAPASPLP